MALADDEPGPDGAAIFAKACAVCHGATGDGEGILTFDRPARSFIDGGFSFGNTRTALFRTVTSGIGGTPMPGFEGGLSEAERYAVVDYVISLGPERTEADPSTKVMVVGERPLVARGYFAALEEDGPVVPRGVLLGGLDGLSMQYDASTMRLMAARTGGFVERRDWENRGGDVLHPLGALIFDGSAGPAGSGWQITKDGTRDLVARLVATEVSGGKAWVEYDLFDRKQKVARVRESSESVKRGGWSGFHRSLFVTGAGPEQLSFTPWGADQGRVLNYGIDRMFRLVEQPVHGTTLFGVNEWLTEEGFCADTYTYFGLTDTPENLAAFEEAL